MQKNGESLVRLAQKHSGLQVSVNRQTTNSALVDDRYTMHQWCRGNDPAKLLQADNGPFPSSLIFSIFNGQTYFTDGTTWSTVYDVMRH